MATCPVVTAARAGDAVTVLANDTDPLILSFQRYAVVSRVTDGGAYVILDGAWPSGEEFGPFPLSRLLPGWRDKAGRWRAP